jgi:hypothetical protein
MPDDPKPHLDENGFVILDEPEPSTAHLAAEAVVACGMCDDDGYRGGTVCDHQDRSEIAARGSAAVRAALAKGRES